MPEYNLAEQTVSKLTKMYGKYVENNDPSPKRSNTKLAIGTAASVISAAIDRVHNSSIESKKTIEDGDFWDDEDFTEEIATEDDSNPGVTSKRTNLAQKIQGQIDKTQDHFVDIVLDKMMQHVLPTNIPDRHKFEQRIRDSDRKQAPGVSISIMTKNLRVLTTKLGGIFEFQTFLIQFIKWKNPSMTVAGLIVISTVCVYPVLLLILPLVGVMYGIMIPGYLHRHPIEVHVPRHQKQRGTSLFEYVTCTDEAPTRYIEDYEIQEEVQEIDTNVKTMKQNMEFMINLQDLQNNLTGLVEVFGKLEKFVYGTAGFKDERVSTSLFIGVLTLVLLLLAIGPYIKWRPIIISNTWISICCLHPKILRRIKLLNKKFAPSREEVTKVFRKMERLDIILDEAPESKVVEVFHIEKQGLTPNQWIFYKLSAHIFDTEDSYRKSQKPPPGVDDLSKVLPPATWSFDSNSDWSTDTEVSKWADEHSVIGEVKGEWLVDDQFRRKRLLRTVTRYAKPARKPIYV